MCEIIPAILEKDWQEIEKKLEIIKPFAKSVHIDICDGKLVPNTSFLDPKPFRKYANDFLLELHMMVEEPIEYLRPFADAGFKRFLGHIEKMSDQVEFVAQGQLLGEVGLAVDGPTSLDIISVPYDDLDALVVMAIKAGFSGQTFQPEQLEKVKAVRQQTSLPVEVDGGMTDMTIKLAKDVGATRFVSSSFLFNNENPQNQYQLLQRLCKTS